MESDALTEREQQVLRFERGWWKYAGAKDTGIREQFDLSPSRYYQLLDALIGRPEALAFDPPLVNRLIRLRDTWRAARSRRAG